VLDFYCAELHLAIELDGGQHYGERGQLKDRRRDEFLRDLGIRVLRFGNQDVLTNLEGVLEAILAVCR
jgi:adenine-specific DNA-methyltransferase